MSEHVEGFWSIATAGIVKDKVVLLVSHAVAETKEQAAAIGILRWREEYPGIQDCAAIASGPFINTPATSA